MARHQGSWDAIVVGSGIGGLACAAALAQTGHAVLLVELHYVAGGLTQTFQRKGFRWDVGVHYLGEMEPEREVRRIIDWLTGGTLQFADLGDVYDVIHFPGGFEAKFARPQAALQGELKDRFPASAQEIDAFFAAMAAAERTGKAIFTGRALPALLARIHRFWHRKDIRNWWGRTSVQVLEQMVSDPKLRAVLMAQRANYGGTSAGLTSFGVHAMVMRHYFKGAYYPVGGAKAFADALVPVIEKAGGEVRLKAKVRAVVIEKGRAAGVELDDGTRLRSPRVVSDIGARNTVGLLPVEMRGSAWAQDILSLAPSMCHVTLYLGLEGDIRAHGASTANHWFHANWDLDDGVWHRPETEASPDLFVSFPSLKDPAHDAGDRQRHTAEVVTNVSWDAFTSWQGSNRHDRPADYTAFKARIERNLAAQFARCFPALAPMVVVQELSTPLTTVSFTGAQRGAIYGLEVSPRRFLSDSLRVQTPVPGLCLAGQDVVTPGVVGAMMGGVLAAAAMEPRVYPRLR